MKDARGGTHSLAESVVPLPARHGLIELIGHSAAQVQPLLINAEASRSGGNGSVRAVRSIDARANAGMQGRHSSSHLRPAA